VQLASGLIDAHTRKGNASMPFHENRGAAF
jgi:hypothetical protein